MTDSQPALKIGVLTSGGDAPGMNAAVRSVVRTAIKRGAQVYTIHEGYQGMIDGGDGIRRADWSTVRGILGEGGTRIGTFRSQDFRTIEGRRQAALNLLLAGIDRLIIIGGDGSLSGMNLFREEWKEHLAALVASGDVTQDVADAHPELMIAGIVGSIDNDMVGVDSTIGADTALQRILDAIDSLSSTAASHHRSFVLEVMGRHCGYLALAAAVAGGCDYVLIPELPPTEGWEQRMLDSLRQGRARGHRDSMVVIAEGARDADGNEISSEYVRSVIAQEFNESTRTTILGHVQRGGTPSAFDRWASSWLGYEAVDEVMGATPGQPARIVGLLGNTMQRIPLMKAVEDTQRVPELIGKGDYKAAMDARGPAFNELADIFNELNNPAEYSAPEDAKRIGIVHAGGLAPGMNTAARAAVRLAISRGHKVIGIRNGFNGLRKGRLAELSWDDVEGWTGQAGAELGIRRAIPTTEDLYKISRQLEDHRIDALLVIGGWNAYQAAYRLHEEKSRYPAFNIPIVAVPASIDNNLPGTEMSIGADTALNVNTSVIDMIKMSGSATTRCFVVETMGRYCGFQALMSGLAGGAERVHLNEEGISLNQLSDDVAMVRQSFDAGRRLFLTVRNEKASESYTTEFVGQLLEGASEGAYDVRTHIIGHVQQGAEPSPSDRLLATRMANAAVTRICAELDRDSSGSWYIGVRESKLRANPLQRMYEEVDANHRRPTQQWWLQLRPVFDAMAEQPEQRYE